MATQAHQVGHPSPQRGQVGLGALWFGLFGAPAAWSVQTLANYALAAHSCYPGLTPRTGPTFPSLWGILMAISIGAVVVTLIATGVAIRSWQRSRGETGGGAHRSIETGEGRTRFMATAGVMASITFFIASIAHLASILLVPPCA